MALSPAWAEVNGMPGIHDAFLGGAGERRRGADFPRFAAGAGIRMGVDVQDR